MNQTEKTKESLPERCQKYPQTEICDTVKSIHPSRKFRKPYRPASRVISNRYIPFLPLLAKLDSLLSKGSVRLAIEGGSASGKTTLGTLLEQLYDCTLFHMNDFFLQPHQRTPKRLAEPGGNVDRDRFLEIPSVTL